MKLGKVCMTHGHQFFIKDEAHTEVDEDLCECPCHSRGNPKSVQTAISTKSSKYAKFKEAYMKVPVQYGHLSRVRRRCNFLGTLCSTNDEVYHYFRICDDEPSGGRFFKVHEVVYNGEFRDVSLYTTYSELPYAIKDVIAKGKDSYIGYIDKVCLMTPAQKAMMFNDTTFFAMDAMNLASYMTSYEYEDSIEHKTNALEDVIFTYPWECVDFDLTREANKKVSDRFEMVVMLKDGRRIIFTDVGWKVR